MNTVQSFFAALLGYAYTLYTRHSTGAALPVIPSWKILWPLTLVAITSSLSSPFGYASLQHVDYITFILAKSCKLLPVMFLHVTLYGKRYPFYKYAVVALVTAGVAIFTLHQPAGSKKKSQQSGNSLYGLLLLGINLLFDGLTNSTQDDIHASFQPYSGPQMMAALNAISTVLTSVYLLLSPYLAHTGIGGYVGMDLAKNAGELQGAVAFIQRHPSVGWDILGFAACGAIGQVFICTSAACIRSTSDDQLTGRSPDVIDLRQSALGHGDCDQEDADHDHLGRLVRSHTERDAMARRRAGLWRDRCRGGVDQAGEKGQGAGEGQAETMTSILECAVQYSIPYMRCTSYLSASETGYLPASLQF